MTYKNLFFHILKYVNKADIFSEKTLQLRTRISTCILSPFDLIVAIIIKLLQHIRNFHKIAMSESYVLKWCMNKY
jgi:hypothetical protein